MEQEIFDFYTLERLDWHDFMEDDENRRAIQSLIKWPDWNSFGLIIHGEAGTGKTHLAALWAQTACAVYVLNDNLNHSPRDLFNNNCNFVFDNFDSMMIPINHHWVFDFLNITAEKKRFVLLLSRQHPSLWNVEPSDLRSRLFTIPTVKIETPRDTLLLKIARKIARDLNIAIHDDVLVYLLNTIERRVDSIANSLRTLNKLALRQKKKPTISFVKKIGLGGAS
ncbi:MAG: hypothetical protein LBG20_04395 [Holosporaceae bacterium]|jgi:chromosomal replication initiation ATPase DnaA|nr:hypothetical protein [Holosporaceae bacterium]